MGKEILTFNNIEIEKKKVYRQGSYFFWREGGRLRY